MAKGIDKDLDDAWSKLVKLRAGYNCEVPNCIKTNYLNSHHIFTRKNRSVRWDVENGLCLCPSHHTLDSKFSAHGTPYIFDKFLDEYKGVEFMNELTFKANQTKKWFKFEKEELLKELQDEIKKYEKKIHF